MSKVTRRDFLKLSTASAAYLGFHSLTGRVYAGVSGANDRFRGRC